MTESAPALNDPFAVLTGPLAATTRMRLEVVDSAPLSPGMQRLVLTAPELAGLQHQPGQEGPAAAVPAGGPVAAVPAGGPVAAAPGGKSRRPRRVVV